MLYVMSEISCGAVVWSCRQFVLQVIDPILREWRDFARLSTMHGRLSDALARIEPCVPVVEEVADMWTSPLRRYSSAVIY